jgi:hypothetical protein
MDAPDHRKRPISLRQIARTWWPLAFSWLLMAAELPGLSAIVARLPDPKINLAAWGVVYAVALVIESPIVMLLSASTALSKDWDSYRKIRRFALWMGAILTALHAALVFTPLYYTVVIGLIRPPAEIVEPVRVGLALMLPWSWAIGYRRFNQGVLIRFGHSRAIGLGTLIRLAADSIVLTVGYSLQTVPGIVVAATAITAGVLSELLYVYLRTRPVIRNQVRIAPLVERQLTLRSFAAFYLPLVATSLFSLLRQSVGAAALSRMPQALESLAIWPVAMGLVWMQCSLGTAFNEVVVAYLDEPGAFQYLRVFRRILVLSSLGIAVAVAATPLSSVWFVNIAALPVSLVVLAKSSLWTSMLTPGLAVWQSWYQGALLHSRRTRGITESVAVSMLTNITILGAGILWGQAPGLYVGLAGYNLGAIIQLVWLRWRALSAVRAVEQDALLQHAQPAI